LLLHVQALDGEVRADSLGQRKGCLREHRASGNAAAGDIGAGTRDGSGVRVGAEDTGVEADAGAREQLAAERPGGERGQEARPFNGDALGDAARFKLSRANGAVLA
jgi:hypothetical protein